MTRGNSPAASRSGAIVTRLPISERPAISGRIVTPRRRIFNRRSLFQRVVIPHQGLHLYRSHDVPHKVAGRSQMGHLNSPRRLKSVMTIGPCTLHSSPPAHRVATPVRAHNPVSKNSRMAGGSPDRILRNLSKNISFEQIELRMRPVKVNSANVK